MGKMTTSRQQEVAFDLLKKNGEQTVSQLHPDFYDALRPAPASVSTLRKTLRLLEDDGLVVSESKRTVQRSLGGDTKNTPLMYFRVK